MKEKTCCFTGHRVLPTDELDKIEQSLREEIEGLIKQGVCYFGVGGALGFDTLAAKKVLELKHQYPHIKLILVLPCQDQDKKWQESDRLTYNSIKDQCDKLVYISKYYDNECMIKRNRHLVENSDYCICYLTKKNGGTAYTVKYALQNDLHVINIAKKDLQIKQDN